MEDAHLTDAGPQLEVPKGLDINDPLAQAAKNDIMKAQSVQDGTQSNINDANDPNHQMLEGPKGLKSSLYADNKAVALKAVDNLPPIIQPKVKNFFKGGSNGYIDFSV